mgnify:FL=1
MNRISLNGGVFRIIERGKEISVVDGTLKLVIVNAAKVSRSFYASSFDPNTPTAPTCWSADTAQPSPDVPKENRQSARCMDCPQNIRGSARGGGRACRYAQRLAVVLEGDLSKLYQLQLPATSLFGRAKEGKMPMQAYAQHLASHNTPVISVITRCSFDLDSPTPKLIFKAFRSLEEKELDLVISLAQSEEVNEIISLNPPQQGQPFAEVKGFVYSPANAN